MAKQNAVYYKWEVVDIFSGYVKTRGADATSADVFYNSGITESVFGHTLEVTAKRAVIDTDKRYSTPVGVYSWNPRENSWQLQRTVKGQKELCDAAYVGLWLVEYPDQVAEIEIEKPCFVIGDCKIILTYSGNDIDGYTWCICGNTNGLYWETDDYPASIADHALRDAFTYLKSYHEDEGRIDLESFANVKVSCTNKRIAYLNKRIMEAIAYALD